MSASPGTHDALVGIMVEYIRQLGYIVHEPLPLTPNPYESPLLSSFTDNSSPTFSSIDSSSVAPPSTIVLPPPVELISTMPSSQPRPLTQTCTICGFDVEPNLGLTVHCKWCTAVSSSTCKPGQKSHFRESLRWRELEQTGRGQLAIQVQANGMVRFKKQKKIDSRQLMFYPGLVNLHLNQTERGASHS